MEASMVLYHLELEKEDREICEHLAGIINQVIPEAENKIWHAHPVWFLDGNPVVGYDKLKGGVRLLFWSGQSFDEPLLKAEGKFKAAEYRFKTLLDTQDIPIARWVEKSRDIQWDYKNIVKRRGQLERLK
jgi:hypothetical protein